MMKKPIWTTTVAAALAATVGTTAAQAQDWRWNDGYEWGASDGYRGGWRDGYEGGNGDGYRRGWRDADDYNEYYRSSHDDDERAYYRHNRCKRSNGTGGLIIGGLAGGLLGREIARDRTAGALLGGGVGALAGRALDRGQSRC